MTKLVIQFNQWLYFAILKNNHGVKCLQNLKQWYSYNTFCAKIPPLCWKSGAKYFVDMIGDFAPWRKIGVLGCKCEMSKDHPYCVTIYQIKTYCTFG